MHKITSERFSIFRKRGKEFLVKKDSVFKCLFSALKVTKKPSISERLPGKILSLKARQFAKILNVYSFQGKLVEVFCGIFEERVKTQYI